MNRLALFLTLLLMFVTASPAGARPPNVLFVYTDDQNYDTIHALGNPDIETPTLDQLVRRGFSFSNAYCQGGQSPAVCVPSRDEKLAAYPRQEQEMRQHLADYYACITSLDHHLGRILNQLRELKRLDDTIIIFSSDQGLAVGGRHGHMGKQNLYEHFKSPLVLAGPGIPHGSSPALVYLFDLFPTICELAGIPTPPECDGISLTAILRGQSPRVRDSLFAVYLDTQRMVRDDRWKLIWYPKIHRFQLFDLQTDPLELQKLADLPQSSQKLAEMRADMSRQQRAFGDDRVPPLD